MESSYIYLLSSQEEYLKAKEKGVLLRDSLEIEGFIHASPKEQLTRVANKYYKSVKGPLVLTVDTSLIQETLKWEPAAGSLYPHIYGPLNMDAIIESRPVYLDDQGEFNIDF